MNAPKRVVSLSGLQDDGYCEPIMKFRLTYEGPLRPHRGEARGNQKDPLSTHKWAIRKVFHFQLRHLWKTNKTLSEWKVQRKDFPTARVLSDNAARWGSKDHYEPLIDVLADNYNKYNHRFVPLARKDLNLTCSLGILFLRRDPPGSIIHAGDIDNRVKTLIDALRMPNSPNQMQGSESALDGEDPFFCLLEDDDQVSHLGVESDTLLDPPTDDGADIGKARVIITVEIRPYLITWDSVSFL